MEYIITKKELLDIVNKLDDDTIIDLSNNLCGTMKMPNKKSNLIQIGLGVNVDLFEDKKSLTGLLNSKIMLLVIPNKKDISKEIIKNVNIVNKGEAENGTKN